MRRGRGYALKLYVVSKIQLVIDLGTKGPPWVPLTTAQILNAQEPTGTSFSMRTKCFRMFSQLQPLLDIKKRILMGSNPYTKTTNPTLVC